MTKNEKYYDEHIAPVLKKLSEDCFERGMNFLAVVEYNQGERGRTISLQKDASLEMVMINHCMKTVPNIDGYIIGLKRYAIEKGIDYNASIYMSDKL
jgi:hypothetical protein